MDKKVTIGERMSRKGIVFCWIYLSVFGLLAAVGFFNIFRLYTALSLTSHYILSFLIYILTMLFLTSTIGSYETLEFTMQSVNYYHAKGFVNQLVEVFRILKNKNAIPNTSLKTNQILKVNLSYITQFAGWAQNGYRLKMTFFNAWWFCFYHFPDKH